MRFQKSLISAIVILVALVTIIGLSGLNLITPRSVREVESPKVLQSMEKIFLTTKDSVKIVANLYPVSNPAGWIVLSHMMPATKESWDALAKEFQNFGYESIAIDLRGHGESDGGPEGYKNFSDLEHQKSILDLDAAVDYLIKEKGATPDKTFFAGASIGANLSLQYISEHPEFKKTVLLSAGLNYYGIETEPLVKNLRTGQRVFFVSSRDDMRVKSGRNNADDNQMLYDSTPAGVQKGIKIYETAGHGTTMLEKEPKLINLIENFLTNE